MPRITPNLWFDTEAEEAARFDVSIFPSSEIRDISYFGEAGPGEPGTVLTVDVALDGQEHAAINGGPQLTLQRGDLAAHQLRRPGGGRPRLVGAPTG